MLTLEINDTKYSGWETADIKRSIESLSGEFNLQLTDKTSTNDAALFCVPGVRCRLKYDSNVLIDGYIDRPISISYSVNGISLSISGRDKTGILIDCTHIGRMQYSNVTIGYILSDICSPYSVPIFQNSLLNEKVKKFVITPTEKCFEIIDRLCKSVGVFASVSFAGEILISQSGTVKITAPLVQGFNIKTIAANISMDNRYAKYKLISQNTCDDFQNGKTSFSISATATDPEMLAMPAPLNARAITIQSESSSDQATLQTRADWECAVRAGRSTTITISVQGFYDPDGNIWDKNKLIDVYSPKIFNDEKFHEYLICEVSYSVDLPSGTVTTLLLRRKDAYLPEPIKIKTITEDKFFSRVRKDTGSKL